MYLSVNDLICLFELQLDSWNSHLIQFLDFISVRKNCSLLSSCRHEKMLEEVNHKYIALWVIDFGSKAFRTNIYLS